MRSTSSTRDPVDGLHLAPVAVSWDVSSADRGVSSWFYRVELSGPSPGPPGETRSAARGVTSSAGWSTPRCPWAGMSVHYSTRRDTGSLAGVDRASDLSEEASGPVGAFLPVARYEPAADDDLDADDADDPLALLRRISARRRVKRC